MTPLTDLIFKTRHQVTIPTSATINESAVKEFGLPTTNIPGMDKSMYNAPITVYATINEQITYWEKGNYVRISKTVVAQNIYRDIQKYLKSWILYLKEGTMNRSNPPTNDLRSLDRYAAMLHELLGLREETEYHASDIIRILNPSSEVADGLINTERHKPRAGYSDFFDSDFMDKKRI